MIWDRFGSKFEKLYYLKGSFHTFIMFGRKGNLEKTIVVVILAVLTLAAFSMLSGPSVRADASEAKILSYSWYVAPSSTVIATKAGDLIVVGEVKNIGSNVIGNVTIEGAALSSTGQTLASTSVQAFVYHMLPGQKAPFYVDFTAQSSTSGDLSWVSSVNIVTVSVSSVEDTAERQYSGLTLPNPGGNTSYIDSNGTYTVYGTMVNTGNQAAVDPWVVATFYNSAGTVIGLNYTEYLTNSLAPGDPVRFFATPADNTALLSSEIASYTLQIDSLTITNSSSTQPTSSPTASLSTSTAQLPTLPIVVVVVLVVVVIAALMLLRKRQKTTSTATSSASSTRIIRIQGFRLFNAGENRIRVSEIIEGVKSLILWQKWMTSNFRFYFA